MNWPIVTLSAEELDVARHMAEKWSARASSVGAAEPHYPHGTRDSSLDGHVRGCKAEIAAAKYTGVYWASLQGVGSADIGARGEVKAVREPMNDVWVRDSDAERGLVVISAYATTSPDDPAVVLRGWVPAATVADLPHRVSGRSKVMPWRYLRPMEYLDAADLIDDHAPAAVLAVAR